MDWRMDTWGMLMWVSPFRHLRIKGYLLLPVAFRSLSRLSSALSAKASTLRSFLLDLVYSFYSVRNWVFAFNNADRIASILRALKRTLKDVPWKLNNNCETKIIVSSFLRNITISKGRVTIIFVGKKESRGNTSHSRKRIVWMVKRTRAQGECLGTGSRWKTW